MGDRIVFGFKQSRSDTTPVFLYSHWGGSGLQRDLVNAIKTAEPRWNDAPYATRIAISQIVGDQWGQELGFGISAGYGSYGYPDYSLIPIICWEERIVEIVHTDEPTKVAYTQRFEDVLSDYLYSLS